jgi:hypothetical protein
MGTDGLRKLRGATTPGYCLKPFQGFEDGLGKGRSEAGSQG